MTRCRQAVFIDWKQVSFCNEVFFLQDYIPTTKSFKFFFPKIHNSLSLLYAWNMCVNVTAPAEHGIETGNQNSVNSIWSLDLLWRKDSVLEVLTMVVCWSVFQDCECSLETSLFTETLRTGEEKLQSFPNVSEGFFPVTRCSRMHPPPVLASHLLSHVFPQWSWQELSGWAFNYLHFWMSVHFLTIGLFSISLYCTM